MNITLIVAAAEDNAIGKDNKMLWHLRADMQYFKNTTWGLPVIMGRKTFESLGKPLAGRANIVITTQASWTAAGVEVAHSLSDALALAEKLQTHEVFVIGGGQVYAESMPLAHTVLLTRVHTTFPDADVYFPELDGGVWHKTKATHVAADAQNDFACTFEVWQRVAKM